MISSADPSMAASAFAAHKGKKRFQPKFDARQTFILDQAAGQSGSRSTTAFIHEAALEKARSTLDPNGQEVKAEEFYLF